MGNTAPVKHAEQSYAKFLKKSGKPNLDKSTDVSVVIDTTNRKFAIMIEDFVVNDRTFGKYLDDEKTHCLGSLLLFNFVLMEHLETDVSCDWNFGFLCKMWAEEANIKDRLIRRISKPFAYSNGLFYRWNENIWERCERVDVRISQRSDAFNLKLDVSFLGFYSDLITKATGWIQKKLDETNGTFILITDDHIREHVESNEIHFNMVSTKIPCYSSTIDFNRAASLNPKRSHGFNVRLPYDPSSKVTKLVQKFVSNFNCSPKILANHLIRCGCKLKPTITFVIGPGDSGKSTLSHVIQSLYGPFTASSNDKVINNFARTYFYGDEPDFSHADIEAINNNPCPHLVINCCTDPKIDDKFKSRTVHRLILNNRVASDDKDVAILSKITTRKQLGSLLGWSLKEFEECEIEVCDPSSSIFRIFNIIDQMKL